MRRLQILTKATRPRSRRPPLTNRLPPPQVYDYCIRNKLADAALIAKWKKPGYERLCCTYVINTKNYKFGTVSICRVPKHALGPDTVVEDPFTGCTGCASGPGGQRNIFGNKYGQYLAAIQVAREEERAKREAKLAAAKAAKAAAKAEAEASADERKAAAEEAGARAVLDGTYRPPPDEDAETDSGGEDEDGPLPSSGIWAVNDKERAMETADAGSVAVAGGSGAGSSSSSSSSKYGGVDDGQGAKRPRY